MFCFINAHTLSLVCSIFNVVLGYHCLLTYLTLFHGEWIEEARVFMLQYFCLSHLLRLLWLQILAPVCDYPSSGIYGHLCDVLKWTL